MAQINVFVTSNINIHTISKKELSDLYLKKIDMLNGKKIIAIDTIEDHEEFCRKILNKTPSQIHAYWMKQVFLGKRTPPKRYIRKKVMQILKNSKNKIVYSSKPLENKSIYESK